MVFDPSKPRNTTSGGLFAQEIRDNQAELYANANTKISGSVNGSYAVQVTFTQDLTVSLATLNLTRAVGGIWANF
jgi:hypothetical protein